MANVPEQCNSSLPKAEDEIDYSERAQGLRAAVVGDNDGLVSIASSPMMGVVADLKTMLTGFAGLFSGACSMGIGEFVSAYELEIEIAQMKREKRTAQGIIGQENVDKENLPYPNFQTAMGLITWSWIHN